MNGDMITLGGGVAMQARGHLAADLDPLGITTANLPALGMRGPSSELIMRKYFKFGTQAIKKNNRHDLNTIV